MLTAITLHFWPAQAGINCCGAWVRFCTKRTLRGWVPMSAFGGKADIANFKIYGGGAEVMSTRLSLRCVPTASSAV